MKKLYLITLSFIVFAFFVLVMLLFTGIKINTTESIPLGFYLSSEKRIAVGDYVLVCPPDNAVFKMAKERQYLAFGSCPGDYPYLMKKVVAMNGDVVDVTDEGVYINGQLQPHSKPLHRDLLGRDLPIFEAKNYALSKEEVLLMSDISGISFDSRYFGALTNNDVKSVIKPLFTW